MDSYTRLSQLLSGYVNTYRQPDTTELQQCLQAVTPEQRYELVAEVRDGPDTAIHMAAMLNHTEIISCILDSFTAEVRYKLLKVQGMFGLTAIHRAALQGHTQAMRCMLDKVSPEHQIQLLNTRGGTNMTSLDIALSLNQPETAALIRKYIETAKKNIKEKQERKQDLNNADSQRGLKREIVDLKEEVLRLRAELEEQEVLNQQKDQQIEDLKEEVLRLRAELDERKVHNQQKDQQIEALNTTVEVHGVQLQQQDEKITGLKQKLLEMEAMMKEMKGEITQVKQQTQKQEVDVQKAAEELPVLTATTEGHGLQLQKQDVKISALELQGVEQKSQIKANTEGISKNRDDISQQDSLFQKKPDQTAELTEDCCINPEQEVDRPPTPTGEEVEEEDIDRGIQVIDN